jgi:peroxiredoxin
MPLNLKEGDRFPSASLPDQTGQPVALAELADGAPLILTFFRGYW